MRYYRDNTGGIGFGIGWERLPSGMNAFYLRLRKHHHEWKWEKRR